MKSLVKYPIILPIAILILALTAYGIFEAIHTTPEEDPDQADLIKESLEQADQLYRTIHGQIISQTDDILDEIIPAIETQQNRQVIHQSLSSRDLWGAVLYRNGDPWSWNGFHLEATTPDESEEQFVYTSIRRQNNVTVLTAQATFTVDDSSYQLITAKKLSQSTNLPLREDVSFNLAEHSSLAGLYPVAFSFVEPPPENSDTYRVLSTTQNDSAGVVFAQQDGMGTYLQRQEEKIANWQRTFHIVIFLSVLFIFVVFAVTENGWKDLLFQIAAISGVWFWASTSGVIESWGILYLSESSTSDIQTQLNLGKYLMNATFLMLFCLISLNTLSDFKSMKSDKMQLKGILLGFLYGAAQVLLILFFVVSTLQLTTSSSIPLLDLELIPADITLLFYISSAIFFVSTAGISVSVAHFLFKLEKDKAVVIFLSALFSFLVTAFLVDHYVLFDYFSGWQFLLISLLFGIFTIIGWLISYYPQYFKAMSGFRRMLITLLLTSGSIYFIVWQTTAERTNNDLINVAHEYSAEAESDGQDILESVLNTLENRLDNLSEEDIYDDPNLVQVRFESLVDSVMQEDWQRYTFDLHLVRQDSVIISDFSTSINSPGWASIFDLDFMLRSYRGEQLRMETNRPIIWGRPRNIGENFRSFFRGWIPIYDSENPRSILAWVTGSVYQERPDFNKPIRAVMSATTGEDWQRSYYMAEFAGNRVVRSATKGIYTDQPEYNRLSDFERDIALKDSIAFITTNSSRGAFREVLLKTGERNIVKVSTPKPAFNNHLFSFFRLFLPLLFFGLFVMGILSVLGFKNFNLFSQSKRFQSRLIDGFTLATLLFLTVLIFSTQYAINNQSEKNIERDLVNNLKNLGESIQVSLSEKESEDLNIPLAAITTPLNIDAILYQNVWIVKSTTPQIFQQHLFPRILPFRVYEFLFNRERRHIVLTTEVGGETLMVGYRAIVNDDNHPVGAVAIPTFTQSPVYTEQLLETTSYLFGIYLVIFALFTIGALMFSNQLTKPLQLIQQGLNKISRGERKTKIPVTSQDEVGSLAEAYNQMVQKLDEAQQELINAERESAWKEMAQQVAHEIKNPLTPMKLNLQHLQRQLESNPEDVRKLKPVIEKTASNIIEQIESLNKIASDFSKFSKPIRDPFESTDLKNLILSVAELYRHEENIHLKTRFPKNTNLTINCVSDEIRRVIINLIKNSMEAANGENCSIDIFTQHKGDNVSIQITDNGIGIPDEDQEKIFVPNFSTKSSGTGLGLAITKKIIEAHNGSITFSSKVGKGTTFIIELPKHQSN